jgi:hypothetical protein
MKITCFEKVHLAINHDCKSSVGYLGVYSSIILEGVVWK